MDLASKFTISASMLLTGFTIVFAVLLFLIFVIWAYGKIVTTAINKSKERKTKKAEAEKTKKATTEKPAEQKTTPSAKPVVNGVTDEVVAVISAAVYSMYGSTEKVKIKSIKKSSGRSAWASAGVINNTRPF
ncbi:MAG: OadG family protein [Ruminococcus sp.]